MSDRIVIVGGGQAAGQAAASLRSAGFTGGVTLVGAEPVAPYQRPPLSKKYMAGELAFERILIKPEAFYEQHGVELRLGSPVESIDRAGRRVTLADGGSLEYSKLLLATGSRVRRLEIPGGELAGVHYLRTVADVDGIREHLRPGARLVIVGGGYIGLEVAAVAVKAGLDVRVIEAEDRVMSRVVDETVSRFYERMHAEECVSIHSSLPVARLEGDATVERVVCRDGEAFPADLVLIGVGILPDTALAAEAGLEVDDGIVVDDRTRTSDPDICAAGDCTSFPSALYGRRVRLECVQNANEQARAAAATLAGQDKPYDPVPWFWSEQYDVRLQIAGLSHGYDRTVVRGNPDEGRSFAVFYLREGVVIAVDAINRTKEYIAGRKLVGARAQVAPATLADESVDLKELA
ncbi:MAG TPA: FAD-dependent oxidoreductase [Gammaproteobacteria bacterium]|nr:FAD-dependent oxidoreductase [Gammaproteobacteria bacterium]